MLREIKIDEILKHSDEPVYFLFNEALYTPEELPDIMRVLIDEDEEEPEPEPEPEPPKPKRGRLSHKDRIEHLLSEGVTDIDEIVRITGIKKETVAKYLAG